MIEYNYILTDTDICYNYCINQISLGNAVYSYCAAWYTDRSSAVILKIYLPCEAYNSGSLNFCTQ